MGTLFTRNIAGILALLLLVQGCSVWNAHDVRTAEFDTLALKTGTAPTDLYGDLPKVINVALAQQKKYSVAIGEQAEFRNALAFSLVPLSAAAAYLGITSSSRGTRDFLAGSAIGGAAAFGLGQFVLDPNRVRIYSAGSRAIGCAVLASRPFLVSNTEFEKLQEANTIAAKRTQIRKSIDAINILLQNQVAEKFLVPLARDRIATAESLMAESGTIEAAAQKLTGDIQTAGGTLHQTILRSMSDVDDELDKGAPTLESLARIITNVKTAATDVQTVTAAMVASKEADKSTKANGGPQSDKPLRAALKTLSDDTSALASLTQSISSLINRVAATAASAGNLDTCRLGPIERGFTLIPSVNRVSVAPPTARRFIIAGGNGRPPVTVFDSGSDQIEKVVTVEGGAYVLTVTFKKDFAGEARLIVTDDRAVTQKTVTFVKPAVAAVTKTSVTQTTEDNLGAKNDFEGTLTQEQIKIVQKAIGVTGTSGDSIRFGPKTRSGIVKYMVANNLPPVGSKSDELNENTFNHMKNAVEKAAPPKPAVPGGSPPPVSPAATLPAGVDASEAAFLPSVKAIKDVQMMLKKRDPDLEVSGEMTPQTRAAIAAFQANKGLSATGTLDNKTMTALQNPN